MNKVELIGRLAKDVDFRQSGENGISKFTIACDRRFKSDNGPSADFINCVAFGKTAETISKYFVKGNKIAICGRIQTGNYTNKNGDKVYTTEVAVEEFYFVESKNSGSQQTQQTAPPQQFAPQQQMPQNQAYVPQGTNMPPQYGNAPVGANTMPQGYQAHPQYQAQQMPQQQNPYMPGGFMYVPEGSGEETPFT